MRIYEKSVNFVRPNPKIWIQIGNYLDIIWRSEAFSEHRFQVSAQPQAKKTACQIEKETL
jgi:hypothetical protein